METRFRVPGAPQGKARPRVTRYGTYTPKKSKDYERQIQEAWRAAGAVSFGEKPVIVCVHAYFEPPASVSKAKREEMLRNCPLLPAKKPDADNIAKAVCDALNGLAWKDDSQVCGLSVEKRYGKESEIFVWIWDKEG